MTRHQRNRCESGRGSGAETAFWPRLKRHFRILLWIAMAARLCPASFGESALERYARRQLGILEETVRHVLALMRARLKRGAPRHVSEDKTATRRSKARGEASPQRHFSLALTTRFDVITAARPARAAPALSLGQSKQDTFVRPAAPTALDQIETRLALLAGVFAEPHHHARRMTAYLKRLGLCVRALRARFRGEPAPACFSERLPAWVRRDAPGFIDTS